MSYTLNRTRRDKRKNERFLASVQRRHYTLRRKGACILVRVEALPACACRGRTWGRRATPLCWPLRGMRTDVGAFSRPCPSCILQIPADRYIRSRAKVSMFSYVEKMYLSVLCTPEDPHCCMYRQSPLSTMYAGITAHVPMVTFSKCHTDTNLLLSQHRSAVVVSAREHVPGLLRACMGLFGLYSNTRIPCYTYTRSGR